MELYKKAALGIDSFILIRADGTLVGKKRSQPLRCPQGTFTSVSTGGCHAAVDTEGKIHVWDDLGNLLPFGQRVGEYTTNFQPGDTFPKSSTDILASNDSYTDVEVGGNESRYFVLAKRQGAYGGTIVSWGLEPQYDMSVPKSLYCVEDCPSWLDPCFTLDNGYDGFGCGLTKCWAIKNRRLVRWGAKGPAAHGGMRKGNPELSWLWENATGVAKVSIKGLTTGILYGPPGHYGIKLFQCYHPCVLSPESTALQQGEFADLAVGYNHWIGLKSDGSLVTWGVDSFAPPEDTVVYSSTGKPYEVPSDVPITDVVCVGAGAYSSMVMTKPNAAQQLFHIYIWGNMQYRGEVINGT